MQSDRRRVDPLVEATPTVHGNPRASSPWRNAGLLPYPASLNTRLRLPSGPQLTAAILEVPDKLLLLRINRDDRLPGCLERLHRGVDVLELGEAGQGSDGAAVGIARRGVTIGMAGTFARLAI